MFHDAVVDAKTLSRTEIECLTPPSITHGNTKLKILRSNECIGEGVYTYYPDPRITSFLPRIAPITGGESRISIKMNYIQPTNNIFCKFGMVTTKGTAVMPDIANCPVPQGQSVGPVDLSISLNGGHDYSPPAVTSFTFTHMPVVDFISPLYFSTFLNATIHIHGSGFDIIRNVGIISCRTDDGSVDAVIEGDEAVSCFLPPTDRNNDKAFSLELSLGENIYKLYVGLLIYHKQNVVDYSPSSARDTTTTTIRWYHNSSTKFVEYFDDIDTTNISTEFIKQHLQEIDDEFHRLNFFVSKVRYAPDEKTIFVNGANFAPLHWFCKIDSKIVLALRLSQNELSCDVPSHIIDRNVVIQVCVHHRQCSEKFSVSIMNRIQVHSVSGDVGFLDGTTTLRFAMNETTHIDGKCRFMGITDTPLSYDDSSSMFFCTVPSATKAGSVDVHLSLDGTHFFRTSIRFIYIYRPVLLSIDPYIIPFGLKLANVHVYGERFLSGHNLSCVYIHGMIRVTQHAIWISNTEVICPLKNLKQEKWNLTLDYYGYGELTAQNSIELIVISPTSISSVSPSRAPPGSDVTLCGTSMTLPQRNSTCLFDRVRVPASPLSEFCVVCKVPFVPSDKNVSLSYSVDFFSHVWFDKEFEIKSVSLLSVSPSIFDVSRKDVSVAVMGIGFLSLPSQTTCSIGDSKSIQFLVHSDRSAHCLFPHFKDIGFYHLALETSFVKIFGDSQVNILPVVSITEISKKNLVEGFEEIVEITGNDFHHENFTCYLDDLPSSRAIVVTSQLAFCFMPPCRRGLQKFYVSNDGNKNDFVHKIVECIPRISITSLNPSFGLIGTMVEVKGTHFRKQMICQFGAVSEPMMFISSTLARCKAPFYMKKDYPTVPFRILFNDQDITLSGEKFFFSYIDLAVDFITPSHGVIGESTSITVHLAHGSSTFVSFCKFGNLLLNATIVSGSSVACETPISNENTVIPIELSSNGVDATSDGFSFYTIDKPSIQDFSPKIGTEDGGTHIIINVLKFPRTREAVCRFGDLVTSSIAWMSMSQLSCMSPVLKPGNYTFYISSNGMNFFRPQMAGSIFEVKSLPSLNVAESMIQGTVLESGNNSIVISREISPIDNKRSKRKSSPNTHIQVKIDNVYPIRGLIFNSHVIHIVGTGFDAKKNYLCIVGRLVIDALLMNTTRLECTIPSVSTPETFQILISEGGRIILSPDSSTSFSFIELAIAGNQRVLHSEASEGLIVSLSEENAHYVSHCWFDDILVQATPIDKAKISCEIPEIKANIGARIELSSTGKDVTSSFSFYRPQNVHRIKSLSRKILSDGKPLVLFGENFVRSSNSFCIFSDIYHSGTFWISDTEILCQSSPSAPGIYEVGLSLNGFKASLIQTELIVQPNAVPSYAVMESQYAGLFISVYGSYFISESDAFCILDLDRVKGSVVHSTLIICIMTSTVEVHWQESLILLDIDDVKFEIPLYIREVKDKELSFNGEDDMEAQSAAYSVQEGLHNLYLNFDEPVIFSFSPLNGVKLDGTTVSFFGHNLHRLDDPICYFGSTLAIAVSRDEKRMQFRSPSIAEESNVTISVKDENSNFEWSSYPTYFSFLNTPKIHSISNEFHKIIIIGENLNVSNELWMRFNETPQIENILAAILLNETHAVFKRNSLNQVASADISINRVNWITNLTVQDRSPITVTSIQPNISSTEGNVIIEIQVAPDISNMSNIKCCFGSHCVIRSKIISNIKLQCRSPKVSLTGRVPFSLSIDDGVRVETDHIFEFIPPCIFRLIEPNVTSYAGGELITLYVDGLQMHLDYYCRFGLIDILGTRMSNSILVCKAPHSSEAHVSVKVFNSKTYEFCLNGFDTVNMQYLLPFSITEISPIVLQMSRNVIFSVTGLFFDQGVPMECNFGTRKASAYILTNHLIECEFQGPNEIGQRDFFISSKRCLMCESNVKVVRILEDPVITSIIPSELVFGVSHSIEISGFNFDPLVPYHCEFENLNYRSVAEWLNHEKISCISPKVINQTLFQISLIISDGYFKSDAVMLSVRYPIQLITMKDQYGFLGRKVSVKANVFGLSADDQYFFSVGNYIVEADRSDTDSLVVSGDFVPMEMEILPVFLVGNYDMLFVGNFIVVEFPVIDGIHPNEIFLHSQASVLNISGRQISNIRLMRFTLMNETMYHDAVCTSLTDVLISCNTPIFTVEGIYRISFSLDGESFAKSSSIFSVVKRPAIFYVNPRLGNANGGTNMRIHGVSFRGLLKPRCKFGNKIVDGIQLSDTEIMCIQPTLNVGFHTVQIGINDYDFVMSSSTYLSFLPLQLLSLQPKFGPPIGGTNVSMRFSSLGSLTHETIECIFGSTKVFGKVIDPSTVSCISPNVIIEQSRVVSIAIDGISLLERGREAVFYFVKQPSIVNIFPETGSISGGTKIKMFSHHIHLDLVEDLTCRFGKDYFAKPLSVNKEYAECVSPVPESNEKEYRVSLHYGRSPRAPENGPVFIYIDPIIIYNIYPVVGNVFKETLITVQGNFKSLSPHISCQFGNMTSSAKVIRSKFLQCTAPAQPNPQRLGLFIITDGGEILSENPNEVFFEYVLPHEVHSIHPTYGSYEGSTLVTVTGSKFSNRSEITCHFGLISTPAFFVDAETIQCSSPLFMSGNDTVFFKVCSNMNDCTDVDYVYYQYIPVPRVVQVDRFHGPLQGGTKVQVQLSLQNSTPVKEIVCAFGGLSVDGMISTYEHDEYLLSIYCISPPGLFAGRVTLEIRVDQNSVSIPSISQFLYHKPMRLHSFYPREGFSFNEIRVDGENFIENDDVQCFFGNEASPLTRVLSSTEIMCIQPTSDINLMVEIKILTGGNILSFDKERAFYKMQSRPIVDKINPDTLRIDGSDVVEIIGRNLNGASNCFFGKFSNPSPVILRTNSSITCQVSSLESSSMYVGTRADLYLSFKNEVIAMNVSVLYENALRDDSAFNESLVERLFYPIIDSVEPESISASGGTMLNINGSNFSNRRGIRCLFGDSIEVPAKYVSTQRILCLTPEMVPGPTTLHVINGGKFAEVSRRSAIINVAFDVSIVRIYPEFGYLTGGTLVEISIMTKRLVYSGFSQLDIVCRFGNVDEIATYVDDTLVMCFSPPVASPKEVMLKLSFDGGASFSVNHSWFTYYDVPQITRISPDAGPLQGGIKIVVEGTNFVHDRGVISCKFTPGGDSYGISVSQNKVVCISPEYGKAEKVALDLSFNDKDFTSSVNHFTYFEPLHILMVNPTSSPSLVNGNQLYVVLNQVVLSTVYHCNFEWVQIEATILSSKELICELPIIETSTVDFSVSSQGCYGMYCRSNVIPFSFFPSPTVISQTSTFPSFPTLIRGFDFSGNASMLCRFNNLVSPLLSIRKTLSVCSFLLGFHERIVSLDIYPQHGRNRSNKSKAVIVVNDFSLAYSCLIPNGTIADKISLSKVDLCAPGTFAPQSGMQRCLSCPVGYICPDFGMSKPVICPSGKICDESGLNLPNAPCPKGHYCLAGTKTSLKMFEDAVPTWKIDGETGLFLFNQDALNLISYDRDRPAQGQYRIQFESARKELNAEQPIPCPLGFFCLEGVGSSTSIQNNFTTPQPCFNGYFCPRGSTSAEGSGPCPTGHYCPSLSQAIPCPLSHYCPGVGNSYPRICLPGTYSNVTGKSYCFLCEIGYMCPGYGQRIPTKCSAGYVCDSEGISLPTKLCPPGYFCEEGTKTDDPDELEHLSRPVPCPAGVFCLGGVAHNRTMEWLPSTTIGKHSPQICAEGYYCGIASSRPSGHGFCFPGHYCPPGSSWPIPVPIGSFSGSKAISPSMCSPGSYAPLEGLRECIPCPAGYSCEGYGTSVPKSCNEGTYRSIAHSISCQMCPTGTYTPYHGSTDVSECFPCPDGRICSSKAMNQIAQSEPCDVGYICSSAMDSSNGHKVTCTSGHFCPPQTTVQNQFVFACDAGHFCNRGTSSSLRLQGRCQEKYFCPLGTPESISPLTQCPRQTISTSSSRDANNCTVRLVEVCDKTEYNPLDPSEISSYYELSSSNLVNEHSVGSNALSTKELSVIKKIRPLLNEKSINWLNDTVEVFRICSEFVLVSPRTEEMHNNTQKVTLIGRNFANETTLTCRFRSFSQTGALRFNISSPGLYLSRTRITCVVPFVPVSLYNSIGDNDFCFLDNDRKMYFRRSCTLGNEAKCVGSFIIPGDRHERFYSLFIPCLDKDISDGKCPNIPSPGFQPNPCFSIEIRVDSSNDGVRFSGDETITDHTEDGRLKQNSQKKSYHIPSTNAILTVIDPTVAITDYDTNSALIGNELVKINTKSCLHLNEREAGERSHETGWFKLQYMEHAHLTIDWRHIPNAMVFGRDFTLAIYNIPSRCNVKVCQEDLLQQSVEEKESVPCKKPLQLPETFTQSLVDKHQFLNLTVFALDDVLFKVEIHILNSLFLPSSGLFLNTMDIHISGPKRTKFAENDKSNIMMRPLSQYLSWIEREVPMKYIFAVKLTPENTRSIAPPYNLPPRWAEYEKGRVLVSTNFSSIEQVLSVSNKRNDRSTTFWDNPYLSAYKAKEQTDLYFETFHGIKVNSKGEYEYEMKSMLLPYLPFTSKCTKYDSYIPLSHLLENNACSLPKPSDLYPPQWWRRDYDALPHPDHISPIGPFDFKQFYPIADWCEQSFRCAFEEELDKAQLVPRWFEASNGTTLFSVVRDPITYFQYTGRKGTRTSSNDGGGSAFVQSIDLDDVFIPVKVKSIKGRCNFPCIPRSVTIEIAYHQVNTTSKRIVNIDLVLRDFDNNSTNSQYSFDVKFFPLNYQELVVKFAFPRDVFRLLFVVIGMITIVSSIIYWFSVRLTTQVENPPNLRFSSTLFLLVPQALIGFFLGMIPIVTMTIAIVMIVDGNVLRTSANETSFEIIPSHYNLSSIDPQLSDRIRQGRLGVAFCCMAIACIFQSSLVFIPGSSGPFVDGLKNQDYCEGSALCVPRWKRSNFIIMSVLMALLLVAIVEWSFWASFGKYIWGAIIFLKVLNVFVGRLVDNQLGELLLSAPLMAALGLVETIITLSAVDFIDFLLSYMVGFGFLLIERMYISPFVGDWFVRAGQIVQIIRDFIKRCFPRSIQTKPKTDGMVSAGTVEPIIESYTGYCLETLSLLYVPYIIILLMYFRDETELPKIYGITERDMAYYATFAIIIIPFQLIADVFLVKAMELFHGWKIYDYLVYARYRFSQRETKWKGHDNSLDECIDISVRSIDHLCFSSQFYLMITIHVNSIIYLVIGIDMMNRASHNLFGDPATPIILCVSLLVVLTLKFFFTSCSFLLNIWGIRNDNKEWHSGVILAESFKLPDWSELREASHEAFEMNKRISSNTFRHKFVSYNRSWLIEQLPNLLTPRTLRRGKPFLLNQLAKTIHNLNNDISSDDEDSDLGVFRNSPTLSKEAKTLLKDWVSKAQSRVMYTQCVQHLIERSKSSHCEQCLGTKALNVECKTSPDELIIAFEKLHRTNPFDRSLWKQFWYNHQKYRTICASCKSKKMRHDRQKFHESKDLLSDLKTCEISKKWLLWARNNVRTKSGVDVSDDSASEDEPSWKYQHISLGSSSSALALIWLKRARRQLLLTQEEYENDTFYS